MTSEEKIQELLAQRRNAPQQDEVRPIGLKKKLEQHKNDMKDTEAPWYKPSMTTLITLALLFHAIVSLFSTLTITERIHSQAAEIKELKARIEILEAK